MNNLHRNISPIFDQRRRVLTLANTERLRNVVFQNFMISMFTMALMILSDQLCFIMFSRFGISPRTTFTRSSTIIWLSGFRTKVSHILKGNKYAHAH